MLKHIFITWSSTFVNICVVIVTCYVTILLLVKLYVTSVYSWVYYILSSLWIFVPATSCSIRVLCLSSVISRNDNDCIIISSHWKSYPYCIEMYKGIFIGVHIYMFLSLITLGQMIFMTIEAFWRKNLVWWFHNMFLSYQSIGASW